MRAPSSSVSGWQETSGLRHREAHAAEVARARGAPDVPLRLLVRRGRRRTDDVEPELLGELRELVGRHERIMPVKAVRIHEDGGPEVAAATRTSPDPVAGPGRGARRLRAASLNHLDVWVRKGLPSVPKPRILGADGAGVVEALGDGVGGLAVGERVVINPGLEHGDRITVVGEHCDGTHCELIAIAAEQVFPLDDGISFEEAAAFPLVYETAYRMLVTRGRSPKANGC